MNFFAHTAEDANGNLLPEQSWQPLAEHLRNVAVLARGFAAPFGAEKEAELAGLLHDLGNYAGRFLRPLCSQVTHGVNHSTAGAHCIELAMTGRLPTMWRHGT